MNVLFVLDSSFPVHKLKASVTLIAWIRNDIEKWLELPWLGNYDIVLVNKLSFLSRLKERRTFSTHCKHRCPVQLIQKSLQLPSFLFTDPISTVSSSVEKQHTDFAYDVALYPSTEFVASLTLPPKLKMCSNCRTLEEFCRAKLIIYDVNYYDWNQLSGPSPVDLTKCGSLVISHESSGLLQQFGLRVPTYHSRQDLLNLIEKYLVNEKDINSLIADLQREIQDHLTQVGKAKFLQLILEGANLKLENRQINQESTQIARSENFSFVDNMMLCVAIRAQSGKDRPLRNIALNILKQIEASPHANKTDVQFYTFNVHREKSPQDVTDKFRRTVDYVNEISLSTYKRQGPILRMILNPRLNSFFTQTRAASLGLDELDRLIDMFKKKATCDWVLITRASVKYKPNWFSSISAHLFDEENDTVVIETKEDVHYSPAKKPDSTHLTSLGDELTNTTGGEDGFQSSFELGSVLIRMSEFKRWKLKFVSVAVANTLSPSRDYHLYQSLKSNIDQRRIKILH